MARRGAGLDVYRRMAEDRFKSLLRQIARDLEFEADYRKAMQKTFEKDYASRLVADLSSILTDESHRHFFYWVKSKKKVKLKLKLSKVLSTSL
jgi:hypothetical protein